MIYITGDTHGDQLRFIEGNPILLYNSNKRSQINAKIIFFEIVGILN